MDYATAQTLKFCAILALCSTLQGQVRDPADILVQARDRVLETVAHPPAVSCTLTAERTYFSRVNPPVPAPSCDQISAERKRPRYKLQIDATDRIRLKVFVQQGREVFAWADPLKFESHDLEEVLERGPMGTGALGGYFMELFGNPEAHFQYLGEKGGKLEYGFQEPGGQIVKAGELWVSTPHAGSFIIDPQSLDPERFTVGTSTLPRETSMCESASAVDYQQVQIGSESFPLPRHAESRDVMVNTQETTSVITYSGCAAELPPLDAPVKSRSTLPENYHVVLAFDDAIDTTTAAAGDVVSATVTKDVIARDGFSFRTLLHAGTRVHGRILSIGSYPMLARQQKLQTTIPQNYFAIAISFDVAEIDGVASPLQIKFDSVDAKLAGGAILAESNRWPEDSLLFHTTEKRFVIPRGFKSEWITTK
jgi:hypothetical protein